MQLSLTLQLPDGNLSSTGYSAQWEDFPIQAADSPSAPPPLSESGSGEATSGEASSGASGRRLQLPVDGAEDVAVRRLSVPYGEAEWDSSEAGHVRWMYSDARQAYEQRVGDAVSEALQLPSAPTPPNARDRCLVPVPLLRCPHPRCCLWRRTAHRHAGVAHSLR